MRKYGAKLRGRHRQRLAAICGLIALLGRPGLEASLSPQDLQILGSALAFMQPPPPVGGVVAIVYAGQSSLSRQDGEEILAAIGKDMSANGSLLSAKLVDSADLAGIGFNLVIVAAGANSEAVMRTARSRQALCVTADQSAVRRGLCTLAVRSAGKVEILLNYRAAQSAGLNFATAFRMMVGEL
jgi:hypothetical protein